ncbi:hypothetical protein GJ496_006542 [Pomphorhynchus laevis]|nr:hypothetical protein GJ496_006542 [Pomphorhynchus laevis]
MVAMKLNIAYPATGAQKLFVIEKEDNLRPFFDKRISQTVDASCLGDEWKGYVLKITGGNDKEGFPMMQGILTNQRVRLLLDKRHSCYRPRRKGERRRKSVRGSIVDKNMCVIACTIVKKGEAEIPGLTDTTIPRRLGPKRASKIRKLFNLSKEDDVKMYVIRKPIKPNKEGRTRVFHKCPKIQRLITPVVLQRKRRRHNLKVKRREASAAAKADYHKLLATFVKEEKEKKRKESQRRSSMRESSRKSKSQETSISHNA